MAPKAWVEVIPGEFMRGMPYDRLGTLQQQFIPDFTSGQIIEKFTAQQGLDEFPESLGSMKTAHFTWDLHKVEIEQPKVGMTTLGIALAETEAGVYAVALLAMPNEYDLLHEKVFIPAVEALTPAVATRNTSTERATITLPRGPIGPRMAGAPRPPRNREWTRNGWMLTLFQTQKTQITTSIPVNDN